MSAEYQGISKDILLMKIIDTADLMTTFGKVQIILYKHQGRLVSATVEPIIEYKAQKNP